MVGGSSRGPGYTTPTSEIAHLRIAGQCALLGRMSLVPERRLQALPAGCTSSNLHHCMIRCTSFPRSAASSSYLRARLPATSPTPSERNAQRSRGACVVDCCQRCSVHTTLARRRPNWANAPGATAERGCSAGSRGSPMVMLAGLPPALLRFLTLAVGQFVGTRQRTPAAICPSGVTGDCPGAIIQSTSDATATSGADSASRRSGRTCSGPPFSG